jgi:hypothetical protein
MIKVNRIELEGDTVTIYRRWTPNQYTPRLIWLERVCEIASGLVNEGVATVELECGGWSVDLEEPWIEDEDIVHHSEYEVDFD